MTYSTPGGPGVSLLFTPHARDKADGKPTPTSDFRSLPSFGRSPGGQHRALGGSARKEPTPTRRRSLTPASQPKDTPPPPPADSLLDSPLGPGMVLWGQPQQEDGVEDMVLSTSPAPTAQQQQQQQQVQQRELARVGDLQQLEDTWCTVYGFRSQTDLPLVLKEFSKCGDIRQFGSFGDGPSCNWVHIQFANKYGAQRALLRSGEQLSQAVMIGVKALDPAHRQAVERQAAGSSASTSFAMRFPKPAAAAAQRPYTISGSSAPVVPLPAKGLAAKLSEFVLGI